MLTSFDKLPAAMQNRHVKRYYDQLAKKRGALFAKRAFDVAASCILLLILSPILLVVALLVKLDSKGPVFFRQERYTRDMRKFRIFKFRTMVNGADKNGPLVTVDGDSRITRMGRLLRRARLDEVPQLFNIFAGDMSFVGTRPEVEKYVLRYTGDMLATLLLPAGLTSRASVAFKDEADMLKNAGDADDVYVNDILPLKMRYNLEYIETFRFFNDISILFSTLFMDNKKENEMRAGQ